MGGRIRQHSLLCDPLKIPIGLGKVHPHPPGDLGLCRTCLLDRGVKVRAQCQTLRIKQMCRLRPAHHKAQRPVTLHRIKTIAQHQRLQRRPRCAYLRHAISAYITVQSRDIIGCKPCTIANLGHHIRQRPRASPPVDPMPAGIIFPIAPKARIIREKGEWPRVPCPDKGPLHIQHRPSVFHRYRIMRRIVPIA